MARNRRIRKTKVVATIGPACDSPETIQEMIEAGMNVARLNLSHGTRAEHGERIQRIRGAAAEINANIAIMADTTGFQIRTGKLRDGTAELTTGQQFTLYNDDRPGDSTGVSISYPDLSQDVRPGSRIVIDDGMIELRVASVSAEEIRCEVTRGERLKDNKGVNVPDVAFKVSGMQPENQKDLLFAVENKADYIAASFVRNGHDVAEIRNFLDEHGSSIPVIAKIENKQGVANLEEIIATADGTMVARGDLGVELALEEVPVVQKQIIRATVMNGKPVITATQMLDSMERQPRPTRAEVSDVANAIFDGTSAVMLSGETAAGLYPVDAVRTMARLALQAEASLPAYGDLQHILPHPSNLVTEAISQAAITMANHMEASAILTLTESGFTPRQISKYRPDCPILALTGSEDVVRKLSMNWGVTPILYKDDSSDETMVNYAIARAIELGYIGKGDVVIVTAGVTRQTGTTNMLRVLVVGE